MRIVEKLERAGSKKNRTAKQQEWDRMYGKGKHEVVYVFNNKTYTREEALEEFYNRSYLEFLQKNPQLADSLCSLAKELYNPHAEATTGVDLQVPAVMLALKKLKKELQGSQRVAIGTWGYNKEIKYPSISFKLSPFKVPLWCDNSISIEEFWQGYKYLAVRG